MSEQRRELSVQRDFWERLRADPTYKSPVELMLLDETAETYSSDEVAALMALVPALPPSARLLELAAGVGRLTPHLARKAAHVTACDFVPAFVAENRAKCAGLGLDHVEHLVADAAVLELPRASLDMVFSNWILMYLTDDAARSLVQRALAALKPEGYLFVHESCDPEASASPDCSYQFSSQENPARYRHPEWYEALFAGNPRISTRARYDLTELYRMDESWAGTQIAWRVQVA